MTSDAKILVRVDKIEMGQNLLLNRQYLTYEWGQLWVFSTPWKSHLFVMSKMVKRGATK